MTPILLNYYKCRFLRELTLTSNRGFQSISWESHYRDHWRFLCHYESIRRNEKVSIDDTDLLNTRGGRVGDLNVSTTLTLTYGFVSGKTSRIKFYSCYIVNQFITYLIKWQEVIFLRLIPHTHKHTRVYTNTHMCDNLLRLLVPHCIQV